MQFLLQYLPPRSFKIDDFHLTWKSKIWRYGWLVFCWKHIFLPPWVRSIPNLKMFPLHCIPEILYTENIGTELIILAKSFSLWSNAYPLHLLNFDRQMDERTTDDNGTIDAYIYVGLNTIIKCTMSAVSTSKIVYSIGLMISVREWKFHANFDVENKSSRERKFHLWNFCSREQKFSGTKVPVTVARYFNIENAATGGCQLRVISRYADVRMWQRVKGG